MSADDKEDQLRLLALVDRAIGLDAEVAQLKIALSAAAETSDEVQRLRNEIVQLTEALHETRSSRTWRIGTAVLVPVHAARKVRTRLRSGPR